jgi:hypothetical protein
MATGGQFYWPSVGISVAAYGQFFMAANNLPEAVFKDSYASMRNEQSFWCRTPMKLSSWLRYSPPLLTGFKRL